MLLKGLCKDASAGDLQPPREPRDAEDGSKRSLTAKDFIHTSFVVADAFTIPRVMWLGARIVGSMWQEPAAFSAKTDDLTG